MAKLKDGNSRHRQALTSGDAAGWVACSCSCSQLPGATLSTAGAPRGRRLRSAWRSIRVSLPLCKAFDLFPPSAAPDCVFLLPCAGCPRERQWEAVELASAAGEAGLPLSLC